MCDCVPDADGFELLDRSDYISDFAGRKHINLTSFGVEVADFVDFKICSGSHQQNPVALSQMPVNNPHIRNNTTKIVVLRVKYQRPQRGRLGLSVWGRDPAYHGFEDRFGANALFCACQQSMRYVKSNNLLNLLFNTFWIRSLKVDFVDDWDDLQV